MKTLTAALALGAILAPALGLAQDTPLPDKGDTAWMMVSTLLVILMTIPGLALFYGGLVRSKNMLSVLMQVFVVFSMITVLWFVYGYSLAFTEGNAYIGGFDRLFLKGTFDSSTGAFAMAATFSKNTPIPELLFVAFQATFAAITVCLIVGAFAERIKFSALLLFSILWFTFAYTPIAHMGRVSVAQEPRAFLKPIIDGRETSYYEWVDAGRYRATRSDSTMFRSEAFIREIRYGFDEESFFLRIDPLDKEAIGGGEEYKVHVHFTAPREVRLSFALTRGNSHRPRCELSLRENGRRVGKKCACGELAMDRIIELSVPFRDLGFPSLVDHAEAGNAGQIGERDLCLGAGNADGADEEAHLCLLVREDMLYPGANL